MEITVKGRHCDVSDRLRQHVADKLAKLERLMVKPSRIDVEICEERNPRQADQRERVELTCHAKGPVIRAEAAAPDAYAALDLAAARLEGRLRRAADRRRVHHGARTPRSVAAATAPLATLEAAIDGDDGAENGHGDLGAAGLKNLSVAGEPRVVREKLHKSESITLEQAIFEMELVGHDFYLFVDVEAGLPSVAYRRRGFDYGVIRVTP
ncbi:MAG: ribosome hibernation-promoting factor, HPF/YfiA family [Actinomycetes bacterium]